MRFLCETVPFAVSSTTDSTPRLAPASIGWWSRNGVLVSRGWRGGRRGTWGTDRQAETDRCHKLTLSWTPGTIGPESGLLPLTGSQSR